MNSTGDAASTASAKATGREWLSHLARLGYGSRGVIYLIIGGLALFAALGQGGGTTDTKGAVQKLMELPAGWLLVLAIALGLVGYSVWRFCQSVFDADNHGSDGKAMVIRGGLLISSISHILLAIWAGKLALGFATGGSSGSKESWVALLMSQPFGRWLVGALGLILIGVGVAQFAKGHRESFEKYFKWDYDERRWLIWFCKFGLYARGVIFAIIGGFIVYAAISTNPSDAGGLQEALQWLRSQPYGPWLLGTIAIGLVCFGIYSGVEAVYRRIQAPA